MQLDLSDRTVLWE